jgi:tRNA(fMet)-specific endonuclease VapC
MPLSASDPRSISWRNSPTTALVSASSLNGEVFEGAFGDPDPVPRLTRIRGFLNRFDLVDLSDSVMEDFARVRTDLRRQGRLIPDLDLLIAATARHHDFTLLTRNLRHFDRIPDLSIYKPE